jgi:hypothetical protein
MEHRRSWQEALASHEMKSGPIPLAVGGRRGFLPHTPMRWKVFANQLVKSDGPFIRDAFPTEGAVRIRETPLQSNAIKAPPTQN